MKLFKDLEIEEYFTDGYDGCKYDIWQKVSKSKAKCTGQVNRGNNRRVGDVVTLSPFKKTFALREVQKSIQAV